MKLSMLLILSLLYSYNHARADFPDMTLSDLMTSAPIVIAGYVMETITPSTHTQTKIPIDYPVYAITTFEIKKWIKSGEKIKDKPRFIHVIHYARNISCDLFEKEYDRKKEYILFLQPTDISLLFEVYKHDLWWPALTYDEYEKLPANQSMLEVRRKAMHSKYSSSDIYFEQGVFSIPEK